jgi:HD-like signal output (HDOD) protein
VSRKHTLSPIGKVEAAQVTERTMSLDDIAELTLKAMLAAIEGDEIALPTLPEVALRVRDDAESPDVSIAKLAGAIGTDAALTARILKVVNSPLLRSGWEITDLQSAIGRLGVVYTSNLAVGLAMEQMFRSKSKTVDKKLREIWRQSLLVAGLCYVICRKRPDLNADQAILAGLVHMLGVLPILTYVDAQDLALGSSDLEYVISQAHPVIGHRILSEWNFPSQLADVPTGYADLTRCTESLEYVDVVQAACILSAPPGSKPFGDVDWNEVPSLEALGLKRSEAALYLEEAALLFG